MPSLQDITLPASAQGQPAALINEFLNPIFRSTSELLIVSPSLEPTRLARLTWGLSAFLQRGPHIKLIIVLVDPLGDSPEAFIDKAWEEAQSDHLARERLGALAWLYANNRLKLEVRSLGSEATEPLSTQLYEGIGFLVAVDEERTGIQVIWKDIPATGGNPEAAINFRWSFGDPNRTVRILLDQLRQAS